MKRSVLWAAGLAALASPAVAAVEGKPFFSLYNTDIVVAIAFVLFLGVLAYFRVHVIIGNMLDKRAETIRNDLDEARALREEAQQLLASYERKQREVSEQAERIVEKAKVEAQQAADQARKDIETSIARRIRAAEDQLASAEAAALRNVRDRAASVAVAAAAEVIASRISAEETARLIDAGIGEVEARLH